jgi:urease
VEVSPSSSEPGVRLPYLPTGKSIREGMGQATNRPASEALDLVITNALIVDWSAIFKVRMLFFRPTVHNAPPV